jgi:hypothetical protein
MMTTPETNLTSNTPTTSTTMTTTQTLTTSQSTTSPSTVESLLKYQPDFGNASLFGENHRCAYTSMLGVVADPVALAKYRL